MRFVNNMSTAEIKREESDIEKYDEIATQESIKYNLHSAVLEYIDTFGFTAMLAAVNEAIAERLRRVNK